MKSNIKFFLLGVFTSIALILGAYFWSIEKMIKVHVTESPLMLSSSEVHSTYTLLPAGTTLYFDKAMPEGFTRYKVYINLEKSLNDLKLSPLKDPTLIDPIWADALQKEDLKRIIATYPITRSELSRMLNSPYLSKSDIEEVLKDHIKTK